ncbi:MAG: hypothetical protein MI824_09155 [Hyphomicrobiales bacterium]|nr:hypothetical protein [Hyphomicrobiales bacterium]
MKTRRRARINRIPFDGVFAKACLPKVETGFGKKTCFNEELEYGANQNDHDML